MRFFNKPAAIALPLLLALLLALPALAAPGATERRVTPVVEVVKAAGPAVVNISSTARRQASPFRSGDDMLDRFFQEFFRPLEREQTNLGSGVIIDGKKGLIVTNSHVVEGGSEIKVQLADRRVFSAQLVGGDPSSDLAVLRIDPGGKPLPQVKLGDSRSLMIGESLVAIGNPFGLQHYRDHRGGQRHQPPGAHRAGLLHGRPDPDRRQHQSGQQRRAATQPRRRGHGHQHRHLPAGPGHRLRHPRQPGAPGGQRSLDPGQGAAHLAGPATAGPHPPPGRSLRPGLVLPGWWCWPWRPTARPRPPAWSGALVILALDEVPLEDTADYQARLGAVAPGDKVRLWFLDHGRRQTATLTAKAYPLEHSPELVWQRLGLEAAPMDQATARLYGARPGGALMIAKIRPGSKAERARLKPGDLLLRVGREPVEDVREFHYQMVRARHQPEVAILFQRGRARQVITFGR